MIFSVICQNASAEEVMRLFKQVEHNLFLNKKYLLTQTYYKELNRSLKSSKFSNWNLEISHSRTHTEFTSPYNFSSILLSDNIDLFNKAKYDIELNEINGKEATVLLKKEKQQLFKEVLRLYTSYLLYKSLIDLEKEKITWIKENLSFAKSAVKEGSFPSIEVSKWEAALLKEEETLVSYKMNMDSIRKNLEILCGTNKLKLEKVKLPNTIKVKLPNTIEDIQYLKRELFRNDPSLQLLKLNQKALKTKYLKEKNYWLPTVSIFSEYQYNRDPGGDGNQYSVGVSLNFKLFNSGQKYKLLSIKSKDKYLNIFKKREKLRLIQRINSLYASIMAGFKKKELLGKRCKVLKDILERYETAYKMRICDFRKLNNYYQSYMSAKLSCIRLKYKLYSKYQLLKHLAIGDIYK